MRRSNVKDVTAAAHKPQMRTSSVKSPSMSEI